MYGLYGIRDGMQLFLYFAAAALVLLAQVRMQAAYKKYSKIQTVNGITGAETARRILAANNITNVEVREAQTDVALSDHYDPRDRTVTLSKDIFRDSSIASVAVAAHEVGHAIQHNQGYRFLMWRSAIAPIMSIASSLSMPMLLLGLFMHIEFLFTLGIIMFCGAAIFQFITLPVEFNASARGLKLLTSEHILVDSEKIDAKRMLQAAAFTYVAALGSTLIQILRLIMMRNNRR
jgi:hypothetical protein